MLFTYIMHMASRYYGFLDLSNQKNAGIRNLVQQTVTSLQNYIANGHQSNAVKNVYDSQEDDGDTKPFDTETKEKGLTLIGEDKSQDENYVNALCKLGHLHLLLGEYSEGK